MATEIFKTNTIKFTWCRCERFLLRNESNLVGKFIKENISQFGRSRFNERERETMWPEAYQFIHCEFRTIKYMRANGDRWLKLSQNFTNKYIACWVWRIHLDLVYCTRCSVVRTANNGNACLRLAYQFGRIKRKIFTFIPNNNNHILSIEWDDTKKWRYVGCRRHHRYGCEIAIMKSVKCTNTLAMHIRLFVVVFCLLVSFSAGRLRRKRRAMDRRQACAWMCVAVTKQASNLYAKYSIWSRW